MRRLYAGALALGLTAFAAAPAPAAPPTARVDVQVPSPGDVSYAVVQVRLGKPGRASPSPRRERVFRDKIGGLAFDVHSRAWRKLRKSTKVYVFVSKVNGGKASLRNALIFVTRRKGGATGPARGNVTVAITNARAEKKSFWVRKVSRSGKATVFHVRNILATSIGNWTRYLRALGLARAMQAALNPVDRRGAFVNGRPAQRGTISSGGAKLTPTARRLVSLIFGTINDRLAWGAAKSSPIVPAFIRRDLNNRPLAARWAAVTDRVPIVVPDSYSAAAKEEAKFVRITSPIISSDAVIVQDFSNSNAQAAVETPRSPGLTAPGTPLAVRRDGTGSGTVTSSVPGIACPPDCSEFYTSGYRLVLTATPDANSDFGGWQGCTRGFLGNLCAVKIDTSFVRRTLNITATFNAKTAPTPPPPPPPPPPGTAPTSLDPSFGSGGVTLTPLTQGTDQLSAFGSAVAAQPDGRLVVVGGRERPGPVHDWVIAQYTANGGLDTSFNTAGSPPGTLVFVENGLFDGASDAVVHDNGNIDVTGLHEAATDAPVRVYQVGSTGASTGFGGFGIGQIPVPGSTRTAGRGISLQPDGKVVVAGTASISGPDRVFVARFNIDGTPDTTFNAGSAVYIVPDTACDTPGSFPSCIATEVVLATSGGSVTGIYVSGVNFGINQGGRVFKLVPTTGQSDFHLDMTYGAMSTPGAAQFASDKLSFAGDILLQPGGQVVVGGQVEANPNNQCAIARLQAGGQPDLSFGSGGAGRIDLAQGCSIEGLAQQADGAFVLAGQTTTSTDFLAVLGRFTSTGQPDNSFVTGGATIVTSGGSPAWFNDLLLQGNKPVGAGGAKGPPHEIQIARYNGG
jgi:uncharacterized delta-60 repeat protein